MSAYNYIDTAMAGMLYGLDNQVETFVARLSAGIEFGYPVYGYVGDEKGAYPYLLDTDTLVFSADLVASNLIDMDVNGVAMAQVTYATSHDNTMDLIVAALNAMTGVQATLDASDTNNRTIHVLTKGVTCAVTSAAVTAGASQATITVTSTTAQVYMGLAVKTQNSAGLYEQYDAVNVLTKGKLYAQCATAADSNDTAYADATTGKLTNVAGGATTAKFRADITTAGLVLAETNGQVQLGVATLFAQ